MARQKLCLRGTTDYWVNAMDGRPFFVVTQTVDPGLIKVLEEQIVPRLLREVPGQPTPEQLAADPWRARFTLVFDRAGYSPQLFRRLWALRIAVVTYHKFPGPAWAEDEFITRPVRLVNGEEVRLRLAERGVRLSEGNWLREIRHLDEQGHQTPMLTTNYTHGIDPLVVSLFARWCQENFFQYMSQHYGLDSLAEFQTRKGQQLERIAQQEQKLQKLKQARKDTPHHVPLKELPEAERFAQLKTARKHFVDTLKLIAYRAETALVLLAREKLARLDDGRALVRQVLSSAADLHPNPQNKTLTVRIHRLATAAHDEALQHLCAELTATETIYPGTDLRLIFAPIGATSLP